MTLGGKFAAVAALMLSVLAGPVAAQTRFVATTGTDTGACTNAGSPCRSIQFAHTQAVGGDTIQIAAGTYSEAPRITKSVTLNGAGAASTIIAPQLANQLPGPAPTPVNSSVILDISGVGINVVVQNLTVRFPSGQYPAVSVNPIYGVWITGGANATIRDSVITEIHDANVSGEQTGDCIRSGSVPRGAAGIVVIQNNVISRCQKTGIAVNEAGTLATISGNTVSDGGLGERNSGGPRTQTVIAPNGIQLAFGARGTISNNTVRRMQCELPSPQCGGNINTDVAVGIGILLFNPGTGTTVTGNTVETSDDGLAPYNETGAIPVLVSGNTFQNNRFRNVVGYTGTIDLARNTLVGAQHGLLAVSFGEARQAISRLNPANSAADANSISGANENGIWVRRVQSFTTRLFGPITMDTESMARATAAASTRAPEGLPLPLVQGSSNRFFGNLVAGVDNQPDEGTATLPCNWWGAAVGPGAGGANPALISPDDVTAPFSINNVNYPCPPGGPTIAFSITKTGPQSALPGAPIQWTVTITNNGPADGGGSVFTDPVPAGVTNVTWACASSNGAACPNAAGSGNNINQAIATFPPGGQLVYTINGTLPQAGGQFTNVATITPAAIPGASAVSATAVTAASIAIAIPGPNGLWLLVLAGLLVAAAATVLIRRAA
jgi:uncharacterized repeat protein (TIGR01451 family)